MLDLEKIQKTVFENSLETCEYISGFTNTRSKIKVHCIKHDLFFETNYENVKRSNRKHYICPECQKEERQSSQILVKCAYCNKEFSKAPSKLEKSKSGLHFCCREHKDLAQKLNSGEQFSAIRPEHYGVIVSDYRKLALRNFSHKCAVCGWDEDKDVLEVHHKDSNRENNNIENLIILCPLCHKKLTTNKYFLTNNNEIKPKDQ